VKCACMEGVVLALYSIAKILDERQFSDTVYASGGFAHSPLWVQILADVFDKRVCLAESVESSALGAAMIGMQALGLVGSLAEAAQLVRPGAEYLPNPANRQVYQNAYEKFEQLYQILRPVFAQAWG
jgi:gluconokinase